MRKIKKVLCFMMAFAMSLTIFSGCKDKGSSVPEESSSGVVSSEADSSEESSSEESSSEEPEIEKTPVAIPVIASKAYTGAALLAEVDENAPYLIKANAVDAVNVGEYDIVLELKDTVQNKWADTDEETVTVKFSVVKAENSVTAPTVENVYEGNTPSPVGASATFGTVKYVYATAEDGEYAEMTDFAVGTYYVKAVVEGTDNYAAAESTVVSFDVMEYQEVSLAAQYLDNESLTISFENVAEMIEVDGNSIGFTQTEGVVALTGDVADGRHTAVVTAAGTKYTIPFVVADYVIRTAEDVANWQTQVDGGTYETYVVLADTIDCTDVTYAPTFGVWYGTFDGYGHMLTNLVVGTTNLGGTRTSSTFVGGTNYGTIKDFALVNVHFNLTDGAYDAETGLCGRLENGLIENCYISGIVTVSGMCRRAGLISALEAGGTVRNCIVDAGSQAALDNYYAVGINGDDATTHYGTTFENVLAIAPENVLVNKADNAEITKVLPTGDVAGALNAFINADGEDSVFSYDEETKKLFLWETELYKVISSYDVEAQYLDNEALNISFDKVADSVEIDGITATFTQEDGVITLTSAVADGRHVAIIIAEGDYYTMPFVVADYVIRTAEDVANWQTSVNGGDPETYVVLADNIDCTNVTYTPAIASWYGTFDGYGHALTNLEVGTKDYGGSATASVFIANLSYGTIKDFALVNVHFNVTNGAYDAGTGLCRRMENGLIENCYISGKVTMTGSGRMAGLIATILANGTVRNCVVEASEENTFGGFCAVGKNGDDAMSPYASTFENVLAIAPAGIMIDKAESANITAVSPTDGTEYAIQSFVENAGANSVWSYDEENDTLNLWNTAVYTVAETDAE